MENPFQGNCRSPHDLNLVTDLADTYYALHRRLGKLLVEETRHLSPQKQPAVADLAPDPLYSQVGMPTEPLLYFGGSSAEFVGRELG
jgi:hypothetical protein